MFEIAPYDRNDTDIIRNALYPRNDAADTSDYQLDLYTCLRAFDQLVDQRLIGQRIEL